MKGRFVIYLWFSLADSLSEKHFFLYSVAEKIARKERLLSTSWITCQTALEWLRSNTGRNVSGETTIELLRALRTKFNANVWDKSITAYASQNLYLQWSVVLVKSYCLRGFFSYSLTNNLKTEGWTEGGEY